MAGSQKPDIDILKQFVDNERFRAFEREVVDDIARELDERKEQYEEERRAREKKARRKRLKKQSSMS